MDSKDNKDSTENKVSVEIFGETYPLKTDHDPAYVRKLASLVDSKMRAVSRHARSFSGSKIAVMAALDLADDYLKLSQDYDKLCAVFNKK